MLGRRYPGAIQPSTTAADRPMISIARNRGGNEACSRATVAAQNRNCADCTATLPPVVIKPPRHRAKKRLWNNEIGLGNGDTYIYNINNIYVPTIENENVTECLIVFYEKAFFSNFNHCLIIVLSIIVIIYYDYTYIYIYIIVC